MNQSSLVLFNLCLLASEAFSIAEPAGTAQVKRIGPYEISLVLRQDGLFAQEEMEVSFRVSEGGVRLRFARFRGVISMPSMAGMASFEEVSHSHGPGDYGVHPTFPHGGEYKLRLTLVFPEGFGEEAAEFVLPVEDAVRGRSNARLHPFRLDVVSSPKQPVAGEPVDLQLVVRRLNTPGMAPATEFDVVHEKKLHVFLIRSDLGEFAHEHPELGQDGVFRLTYSFPSSGSYRVFADVAPKGAGSQILSSALTVAGPAGDSFDIEGAARSGLGTRDVVDGITFDLMPPKEGIPLKKTIVMVSRLTTANGPVRDLQPYLGAIGHLLMIHEDAETFVHCHPDDAQEASRGTVPFLVRFPKAGLYRAWAQFQRQGKVVTANFVLAVR